MYLYICYTYYVECIYDIYRTYNVCNIYIYIYIMKILKLFLIAMGIDIYDIHF